MLFFFHAIGDTVTHNKELEILGKFLLVQMQLFFTIQNIMFK